MLKTLVAQFLNYEGSGSLRLIWGSNVATVTNYDIGVIAKITYTLTLDLFEPCMLPKTLFLDLVNIEKVEFIPLPG